jgi:hypothetical protein
VNLSRCADCGTVIYGEDFRDGDLPELCELCNDEFREDAWTPSI